MEHIGTLTPLPPYNFQLTLDILSRYTHPTTDVVSDGAYWRVLPDGDGLALVRVESAGTLTVPVLNIFLVISTASKHDPAAILKAMAHILSIDSDPSPFYQFAPSDPVLWRVVEPLVGLRWLRTVSVFEALMTTIIEQQIAWTAAQRAQRWLVEWGAQSVPYNGMVHYAFPTPEQIAHTTEQELTPLKITFKRMRVMIDIARQVMDGTLDLERLRDVSAQEAYQTLVGIKGIGHWTATWTLQRTQGWHNYVGHNDVALQAAVNHYFYGGVGRIPAAQVQETFARYGDYAGMAANYTIMRWVLERYEQR